MLAEFLCLFAKFLTVNRDGFAEFNGIRFRLDALVHQLGLHVEVLPRQRPADDPILFARFRLFQICQLANGDGGQRHLLGNEERRLDDKDAGIEARMGGAGALAYPQVGVGIQIPRLWLRPVQPHAPDGAGRHPERVGLVLVQEYRVRTVVRQLRELSLARIQKRQDRQLLPPAQGQLRCRQHLRGGPPPGIPRPPARRRHGYFHCAARAAFFDQSDVQVLPTLIDEPVILVPVMANLRDQRNIPPQPDSLDREGQRGRRLGHYLIDGAAAAAKVNGDERDTAYHQGKYEDGRPLCGFHNSFPRRGVKQGWGKLPFLPALVRLFGG